MAVEDGICRWVVGWLGILDSYLSSYFMQKVGAVRNFHFFYLGIFSDWTVCRLYAKCQEMCGNDARFFVPAGRFRNTYFSNPRGKNTHHQKYIIILTWWRCVKRRDTADLDCTIIISSIVSLCMRTTCNAEKREERTDAQKENPGHVN